MKSIAITAAMTRPRRTARFLLPLALLMGLLAQQILTSTQQAAPSHAGIKWSQSAGIKWSHDLAGIKWSGA